MGFFTEYPYRNLTDINLDWILQEVSHFADFTKGEIDEMLNLYIEQKFNDFMLSAIYDANARKITFRKE